ncbi:phosphoribosylanthranilate isomerase [Sulfurimonas sp. MAG313]|nr:phosphoribosylanthranilate isomerase [Sulfurimonas sp. MAG313]MDF1880556.1 phosphoribosylanthranilate isomerase [Sulfurimonas sp. MAG313]
MRVKICGITTLEDAQASIKAGAQALGFVFYEKSPRYISALNAKKIINELPPFVEKVGLFVNVDAHTINTISKASGITLIQLHFDVEQELCEALELPYIKVVRAQSPQDIKENENTYRLVDAYCENYGGMGKRLNLQWFKDVDCSKIILAGGLSAQNIKECLPYGFYALDVSSGVELSKGVKDSQKVQDFINAAQC